MKARLRNLSGATRPFPTLERQEGMGPLSLAVALCALQLSFATGGPWLSGAQRSVQAGTDRQQQEHSAEPRKPTEQQPGSQQQQAGARQQPQEAPRDSQAPPAADDLFSIAVFGSS